MPNELKPEKRGRKPIKCWRCGIGNWLSEVLADFKIGHDKHIQGKKLALTQWMADLQAENKRLAGEVEKLVDALENIQVQAIDMGDYYYVPMVEFDDNIKALDSHLTDKV